MTSPNRSLHLINYENKLCGLRATKALLKEGGYFASDSTRPPTPPGFPVISAPDSSNWPSGWSR